MFSSPRIQDEGTLPEPSDSWKWPVSPNLLVPKISKVIGEFQERLTGLADFKMGIPWSTVEEDLADVWLRAYDSAN